ncbi:MAG: DUF3347 domain-containing protein [Planctomycetes bacterium]|nr:DUF3347 domain-containing protein [Planctomycetota bacterium]
MLKNNYLKKGVTLLVFFYCCHTHAVSAHEGHSHEAVTTIGKKTVVHLQKILSTYQEVYTHLVKKDLNGITGLARKLSDAARQAAQTEPDGAGRHMMQHVIAGAESLKRAKSTKESQEAFASISDALLPFFKSWPNQLKQNELKMCQCKNDGHCWLQPLNCSVACPYNSDTSSDCSDIEEVK